MKTPYHFSPLLILLVATMFSACESSDSLKDAYTLIYSSEPLKSEKDGGCIVVSIISPSVLWADIPDSRKQVDLILRSDRDYYKNKANTTFLYEDDSPNIFHSTGSYIGNYEIFENDVDMQIGLEESRKTLYFDSSSSTPHIILDVFGKVCPR